MSDKPGQDPGDFDGWEPVDVPQAEEPDSEISKDPDERTGIAWGFVAVLILATLVAVFIVQNNEPIAVEFFWFDFAMSIWIVVLAIVLITLIVDQVISLFYRRRRRQTRASRSRVD